MNNLLTIVCMAFSIYYAFSAPTLTPAPTSSTKLLKQIIAELRNLSLAPRRGVHLQSLSPDQEEENMNIKALSCRAIKSINDVPHNTDELRLLRRSLMSFTTDVNCTKVTLKNREIYEDLRSFLARLLHEFQHHFFNSTKQ